MSTVSHDDIAHLASLARLTLSDEETNRYASQLSGVVTYVEQLQEANTEGIVSSKGVSGLSTVLAEDVPRMAGDQAAISSEALLAGAPLRSGKYIQVRAVLGGEVGSS